MATAERMRAPLEQPVEKGLKSGALGLVSTTFIATASVAPAYSIAATLVFVVGAVGILPVAGGLMLYFLGGWSLWLDYDVATENDYTMWTIPGLHWQVGGAFVIAVIAVLAGLACYAYCRLTRPAFFKKQTLTRATPTLTPDPSLPGEVR
jgi:hypothetical protein